MRRRRPGPVIAWVSVIALLALMLVWATHEGGAATWFIAVCLVLLIVVPLITRQSKP